MIDDPGMDDVYEEIDPIEVDRVVAALDQLIQSVESETIRSYLETTAEEVSYLVDDDEEIEEDLIDQSGPPAAQDPPAQAA